MPYGDDRPDSDPRLGHAVYDTAPPGRRALRRSPSLRSPLREVRGVCASAWVGARMWWCGLQESCASGGRGCGVKSGSFQNGYGTCCQCSSLHRCADTYSSTAAMSSSRICAPSTRHDPLCTVVSSALEGRRQRPSPAPSRARPGKHRATIKLSNPRVDPAPRKSAVPDSRRVSLAMRIPPAMEQCRASLRCSRPRLLLVHVRGHQLLSRGRARCAADRRIPHPKHDAHHDCEQGTADGVHLESTG